MEEIEKGRLARLRQEDWDAPLTGVTAGFVTHEYPIASWMAERFNHNFDAYDQAIDAIYNETKVGGSSLHHLLDGQHDILGAYRAVREVEADDTFLEELLQASEHLLRDVASVSGVNPFTSFTPAQYEALAQAATTLGISRSYLADILTVNAPELLGSTVALLGNNVLAKRKDPERISRLAGSCLVSSLVSANPALLSVAASGMAYQIFRPGEKRQLLVQAGKGALVSGGTILAGTVVGGPVWLGYVTTVSAAVALNYAIEKPERVVAQMSKASRSAQSAYRQARLHLGGYAP